MLLFQVFRRKQNASNTVELKTGESLLPTQRTKKYSYSLKSIKDLKTKIISTLCLYFYLLGTAAIPKALKDRKIEKRKPYREMWANKEKPRTIKKKTIMKDFQTTKLTMLRTLSLKDHCCQLTFYK